MEGEEENLPNFSLGFKIFVPLNQSGKSKKKKKKKNHSALPAWMNVSWTTSSRELKRSSENMNKIPSKRLSR